MDQQMVDMTADEKQDGNSGATEDQRGTQPNPDGFFADTGDSKACTVRVALRVRPLIGKELRERAAICVQTREQENQVMIGKDRVFTYDKSFGMDSRQETVY